MHIQAALWMAKGKFLVHNGYRIFYYSSSTNLSRPCIVLLHGFPTSSWDWHKMIPVLETRYNIIAPDFLGLGFSDKPVKDYSISEQADITEHLLDHLQISTYHLLAHDYGDTVAQELLARSSAGQLKSAILSVCFLNGGLFPETHRARWVQKLLAGPLGTYLSAFMGKKSFSKSFQAILGVPATEDEIDILWNIISYQQGQKVFHHLLSYMEERRKNRERWVSAMQSTSIPLLVINGPEDPISGQHMTERYRALIPDPHIILLPGTGHYPHMENPGAVLSNYFAFIDRHNT